MFGVKRGRGEHVSAQVDITNSTINFTPFISLPLFIKLFSSLQYTKMAQMPISCRVFTTYKS